MSHPDWAHLRATIINRFNGETPHPITEQEIIDAYQLHPDAVERAATAVAADLAAGTIRSGWGILRHRAEAILTPPANPQAKTGRDLEKRRARAEQWIRNAGLYTPGWDACRESLIEDLHLDERTADTLEPLYAELAPVGRQAEQDAVDRGRKWIHDQARLRDARKQALAELDAAQNSGAAPARTTGTHVAQHGTGQTPPVPAPEHDFPPPQGDA